MSDQLHEPMGWMFIVMALLWYVAGPGMSWISGESLTLIDYLFPLVYVVPVFLTGLYMLTHPYFWWPNHAQDRVARIKDKFDDCKEK